MAADDTMSQTVISSKSW